MSDWDAGGEPVPVERSGSVAGTDGDDRRGDGDDLAALTAELEATLRRLRREVDDESPHDGRTARRPPRERGPLPRPPTPREVLRFTEEYTIPAVVAALESSIRALELLAAVVRLLDGRDPRGEQRRDGLLPGLDRDGARDRAVETGRTALERVDTALADLQRAYEGAPDDEHARALLDDARRLREEIDDRLGDLSADERRDGRGNGATGGNAGGDDDESASVDVEAELETLRRDVGRGESEASGDDGGPTENGGEPDGEGSDAAD